MEEFNRISITEYLELTHQWVNNKWAHKTEKEIVKAFLCCSHLMHIISADAEKFYNLNQNEGKIVLDIIGSMFNIKSYGLIKKVFHNLCVLLKNQFETNEVREALHFLFDIILDYKTNNASTTLQIDKQNKSIKLEDLDEKPDPSIKTFNKTLYSQSPFYVDIVKRFLIVSLFRTLARF